MRLELRLCEPQRVADPRSAREEQIRQLVSKGHSNKLIADKLEMNCETVCTHLKRVFKKSHVNSRTEAAIRYINSKMSKQRPNGDEG